MVSSNPCLWAVLGSPEQVLPLVQVPCDVLPELCDCEATGGPWGELYGHLYGLSWGA